LGSAPDSSLGLTHDSSLGTTLTIVTIVSVVFIVGIVGVMIFALKRRQNYQKKSGDQGYRHV
jgi:hypothetical protein